MSTERYHVIDTEPEQSNNDYRADRVSETFSERNAQAICEALNYKPVKHLDEIMREASGEEQPDLDG